MADEMSRRMLTIPYADDLLVSLKETPEEFEAEARLLLAVKLFEMGRISTGRAAELAGLPRVEFLHALHRFKVSPSRRAAGFQSSRRLKEARAPASAPRL